MFQFPTSTFLPAMYSLIRYHLMKSDGFPHSEISGSKHTYSSPEHIGVRPVLHRLLVPRHPPCALIHLTIRLRVIHSVESFVRNKTVLLIYFSVLFLNIISNCVVVSTIQFSKNKLEKHTSLKTKQSKTMCKVPF